MPSWTDLRSGRAQARLAAAVCHDMYATKNSDLAAAGRGKSKTRAHPQMTLTSPSCGEVRVGGLGAEVGRAKPGQESRAAQRREVKSRI
jgi:hypothetical protein